MRGGGAAALCSLTGPSTSAIISVVRGVRRPLQTIRDSSLGKETYREAVRELHLLMGKGGEGAKGTGYREA